MFDFHRHLTNSIILAEAFYCTSSIEEWIDNKPISLGLLFSDKIYKKEEIDNVLAHLEANLKKNINYQIGEIGLDKRFNQIELQKYFLIKCINLSNKYNRILTVHCVGEFGLLIDLFKCNKDIMGPITIIHGFTSSLEIAEQLKQLNVLISINYSFFKTKSFKKINDFDNLGFLVESDWNKINDDNYKLSFDNFIEELDSTGIKKYKELNNEYRTIFKNFTSYR
jgi:Tat protein secretion system quality control protein TatD with DNase activity